MVWKNSVVKKFETTRDKHADNQHVNHVGPLTTNNGTTIYDVGFNAKSTMPMKTTSPNMFIILSNEEDSQSQPMDTTNKEETHVIN